MLYEIPVIRKRDRIFLGHKYVDYCAYCGTVGGRPIRFYSKDKHLAEEKALQYLSLSKRFPEHQILKRKEIIDICHRKNIEYIGVKRNPRVYEMQDCEIKCEDCVEYKKNEATSIP